MLTPSEDEIVEPGQDAVDPVDPAEDHDQAESEEAQANAEEEEEMAAIQDGNGEHVYQGQVD